MGSQRQTATMALLLAALTIGLYWQVQSFDYVHFDDPVYIVDNTHVTTGLTAENVGWSLTSGYAANWHPLTWISYMAEVSLFGDSPRVFHITNLVLHVLNSTLVLFLFRGMTGQLWPSALVAALFAIHPLHVESVAWVSERKDLLSTLFALLTLCAYVRYVKTAKAKWYVWSLLAFMASLMSKQMYVTLPFLLWVIDYWPLRRGARVDDATQPTSPDSPTQQPATREQRVKEKLPFLALALAAALIVYSVQDQGGAVSSVTQIPVKYRLLNAVVSYGIYLKQLAWPLELAVFYPHPGADISVKRVALVGAALVAATALFFVLRRKQPYLWVGWLWFIGTLVPVIGIVQIGAQQLADRYTYFPALGVFLMVAWAFKKAAETSPFLRQMVLVTVLLMLSVWSVQTWRQVGYWKNSFVLFQHALAVTKNNTVALTNLGLAYQDKNNDKQAEKYYQRAIDSNPNHPTAHFNLGIVYQNRGQLERAEQKFHETIKLDPSHVEAMAALGSVLNRQGKRDEARSVLGQVLDADPDNFTALNNLGIVLIDLQQLDAAFKLLTKARDLRPNNVSVLNNLGQVLAQTGQVDQAMQLFERCLEIDPDFISARFNLGSAYQLSGEVDKAAEIFRDVLTRQADYEPALSSLITVLNQRAFAHVDKQEYDQAETLLREVVARQPDVAMHDASLGMVRMFAQRWPEAKAAFEKAIEKEPGNADFYARLGMVLRKMQDNEGAKAQFQKALEIDPEHAGAKKQLEELKAESQQAPENKPSEKTEGE